MLSTRKRLSLNTVKLREGLLTALISTALSGVLFFCGVRPWAVQLVLRLNNVQIMVGFETETLNGISGDFKLSN